MATTKRRPSPTWRKFEKAVQEEVRRRQIDRPIYFRNLTINFEDRTVDDGRHMIKVETKSLVLPILDTEQIVWPKG